MLSSEESIGAAVKERRRFQQSDVLEERLAKEAIRLRAQAEGMKPGPERDEILRKVRQAETGSHMIDWLSSPGLRPPK